MEKTLFSKENAKRLRKLEDTLTSLKNGSKRRYAITKISSIKSLCKEQSILQQYCAFLIMEILHHPVGIPTEIVVADVEALVFGFINGDTGAEPVRTLLFMIKKFQNERKKVGWNSVRIIHYNDLLVLEYLLEALLASEDVAPSYAYDATKTYVEAYNSSYGTGLIADSIPMLERVLEFWQDFEKGKLHGLSS